MENMMNRTEAEAREAFAAFRELRTGNLVTNHVFFSGCVWSMVTRASIATAHAVANLAAARLGRRRSVSMMISLRSSWQSCTSTVISHALRRISAARVPSSRAGSSSERSESFSLFFVFFLIFF